MVIIAITVAFLSLLTAFFRPPVIAQSSSSKSSSLPDKFIEIKAFEVSNGRTEYTAGNNFTATQLLTLIQQIHNTVGDFNIIRFIRVQCTGAIVNSSLTASDITGQGYNWNGTLNSYLVAIQQAAGGQIIPDADMDIFAGQSDCGGIANQSAFYSNAASLLTLSAIANGERYVMLEAWDAWYAKSDPNESQVTAFFQTMKNLGWLGFIPQDNNPNANTADTPSCNVKYASYADYGYGGYVRNGIFVVNTSSPYVFVNDNDVCSIHLAEPYLNGVLVGIESQLQSTNPAYDCGGVQYSYAIQAFSQCLTTAQQEAALTDLAENQNSKGYVFIYPVVVGEYSILYNALQAGTLGLMEELMNTYNTPSSGTTTATITSNSITTSDTSSYSWYSTQSATTTAQSTSSAPSTTTESTSSSATSYTTTTITETSLPTPTSTSTDNTQSTTVTANSTTTTTFIPSSQSETSAVESTETETPFTTQPTSTDTEMLTSQITTFPTIASNSSISTFSPESISSVSSSSLNGISSYSSEAVRDSSTASNQIYEQSTSASTHTATFSSSITIDSDNNPAEASTNDTHSSSTQDRVSPSVQGNDHQHTAADVAATYSFSTFLTVLVLGGPPILLWHRQSS